MFEVDGVSFDIFTHTGPRVPKIVCLCGSTRFYDEFARMSLEFTLQGYVVLTIGCDTKQDGDIFADMSDIDRLHVKARLDVLHLHKIDLCDIVYVINKGGYIGESTAREIAYAEMRGKDIVYMDKGDDEQRGMALEYIRSVDSGDE